MESFEAHSYEIPQIPQQKLFLPEGGFTRNREVTQVYRVLNSGTKLGIFSSLCLFVLKLEMKVVKDKFHIFSEIFCQKVKI